MLFVKRNKLLVCLCRQINNIVLKDRSFIDMLVGSVEVCTVRHLRLSLRVSVRADCGLFMVWCSLNEQVFFKLVAKQKSANKKRK